MAENGYRYALELYKADGTLLGRASMDVDWEPAREWTRFLALRRNALADSDPGKDWSIEPLWRQDEGEPYLRGFQVRIHRNGEGAVAAEFPVRYFRALAHQASAYFVEKGKLGSGDNFYYIPVATPGAARPQAEAKPMFSSEEVARPLPLRESALDAFLRGSAVSGTVDADDAPVFIPRKVLDEAGALSRAAGARETGGILIGHLHRDASLPEIFAEVTAQIPARHTRQELTRLTFTAETWTDVQAAIDLRRRNEIYLGWWHSHCVGEWCKDCPEEKQKECKLAKDFFSTTDRSLHRTVFPRAYSVALVVNDAPPAEPTYSLYGWRQGLLEARGYYITGGEDVA